MGIRRIVAFAVFNVKLVFHPLQIVLFAKEIEDKVKIHYEPHFVLVKMECLMIFYLIIVLNAIKTVILVLKTLLIVFHVTKVIV